MKARRHSVRRQRFTSQHRAQLLSAFDRSGLCAAQFGAQHGIGASTLFAWRRRLLGSVQNQTSLPEKKLFKQVSLAEVFGSANSWAGEIQLANGTQLRWGHQASAAQLQLVLEHFGRSC